MTIKSIQDRKARVAAAAQAAGVTPTETAQTIADTNALPVATPVAAAPALPVAPAPVAPAPIPVLAVPAAPVAPVAPPVAAAPAPAPAVQADPAFSAADLAHFRKEAQLAAAKNAEIEAALTAARAELASRVAPAPIAPAAPAVADASAALREELATARAELARLNAPRLTAEDWDVPEVEFAQANALYKKFAPLMERMVDERASALVKTRMEPELAAVRGELGTRLTTLTEAREADAKNAFEASVLDALPAARDIVPSMAFKEFLATEMPYTGFSYNDAFNRHLSARNVGGMVYLIKQYQASLGTAPDPALEVSPATAPAAALTAAASPAASFDLKGLRENLRSRQITQAQFVEHLAAAQAALTQGHAQALVH